jgi:hypothetical protein
VKTQNWIYFFLQVDKELLLAMKSAQTRNLIGDFTLPVAMIPTSQSYPWLARDQREFHALSAFQATIDL